MESDVRQSDHDLLVRIDERTKNWESVLAGFVTKKEFAPVKAIAFGLIGIMALSVVGALLSLIIK